MEYYDGKVIMITGGSSGLGSEFFKALLVKTNARLVICGRSTARMSKVFEGTIHDKQRVRYVYLDLEHDDGALEASVCSAFNHFGSIDILINCAGMGFRGVVQNTSSDVDRKVMQVDYFGQIAVIKSLLRLWRRGERSSAHIIQISSVQGYFGMGGRAPYSAAKHALNGFIDSLRVELESHPYSGRIRTTLVAPGYIATSHSANAITEDGSMYNKLDETTTTGYAPRYVADVTLLEAAKGKEEVIIADAKVRFLIWIRYIFPSLCFRILRNKYANLKESIFTAAIRSLVS
jgi:dehydrogenase/reductase SDR family protein 7B